MSRIAGLISLLLISTTSVARADVLPVIEEVPDTYTPGQAFTFTVRAPNLVDFSSYFVEIAFISEVDEPEWTVTAVADPLRYPFPNVPTFPDGTPGLDENELLLTLEDSTTPPVNTNSPTNDLLALVTVTPGRGMTGPITIEVITSEFDYSSETGSGVELPEQFIVEQGADPVPAPPAVVLVGIAAMVFAARKRLTTAKCSTN